MDHHFRVGASGTVEGFEDRVTYGRRPTGFYIPRILYLRGLLAEKEGRAGDARSYYDKFLAVSGPDPLLWGEEKKVRQ